MAAAALLQRGWEAMGGPESFTAARGSSLRGPLGDRRGGERGSTVSWGTRRQWRRRVLLDAGESSALVSLGARVERRGERGLCCAAKGGGKVLQH